MKQLNYQSILIVMLSAMAGYGINYLFIGTNLRQPPAERVVYTYFDSAQFKFIGVRDSLVKAKTGTETKIPLKSDEILFHENPSLLVWAAIMLMLMAIGYGAFPILFWQIKKLGKDFSLRKPEFLRALYYALIIQGFIILLTLFSRGYMMGPLMINKFQVLLQHGYVLSLINLQVIVFDIPALMLIFLVAAAAEKVAIGYHSKSDNQKTEKVREQERTEDSNRQKEAIDQSVSRFRILYQVQSGSLLFLAVTIIFSVLTTSALRRSILTAIEIKNFNLFPAEISIVYGLVLSLFLGIAYLPSYVYLRSKSTELKSFVSGEGFLNGSDAEQKWKEKTLEQLDSNSTPMENFKVLLAVVSPLITSVISELQLFK